MSPMRSGALAALAIAAVTVTACGSQDDSSTTAAGTGASTATAGGSSLEGKRIAMIDVFPQNEFVSVAFEAAKAEAEAHGVKLDQISVNSADPQAEYAAIENAATKDAYDGYVILPQSGVTIVPAVRKLIDTGKPVVSTSIPIGADMCTNQPQVQGQAGATGAAPCAIGKELGGLTKEACEGNDACKVLWVSTIPGFPADEEKLRATKDVVETIPGATMQQTSPTLYDINKSIAVLQNALNANPDTDVIVFPGPQMYAGFKKAVQSGTKADGIKVVVDSPTTDVVADLKAGDVTGVEALGGMPATDAKLATQILLGCIQDKSACGKGVTSAEKLGLPGGWTKANESEWAAYKPEWNVG